MKYIGRANILKGMPFKDGFTIGPQYDSLAMQILATNEHYKPLLDYVTCFPTAHTREEYYISLKKCDAVPKKPSNEAFDLAIKFTEKMYSFMKGIKGTNEISYNGLSTNGVPYIKLKDSKGTLMMHKKDLVSSPDFKDEMARNHRTIYQATTKHEYLPKAELEVKKRRTFFCGETTECFKQKMLYDNCDAAMHHNATEWYDCWSRYGFVKQYGGINRLAEAHLGLAKKLDRPIEELVHMTSDVSGWDRLLPLLPEVYAIRKRLYGKMNELEELWHNNIADSLSAPYYATCEGDIFQRFCGNVSGSGKTTSDNTISHTIIKFYCFISLFYDKFFRMPSYEEITDYCVISVYGDDDLTTVYPDDWVDGGASVFKDRIRELYQDFGLTIKEGAYKVQSTLVGLEFLGSTFYKSHTGFYYGQPRYDKICSSVFQYLEKPKSGEAYCSTSMAVEYLICGLDDPVANILREFNKDYAKYILESYSREINILNIMYLRDIAAGSFDAYSLATGFESAVSKKIFSINEDLFEEVLLATQDIHFQSNKADDFLYFFFDHHEKTGTGEGFKSEMEVSNNKYYPNVNYVNMVLERLTKEGKSTPHSSYERWGPDHLPQFMCSTVFDGQKFTGVGNNKSESKNKSYCSLFAYLSQPVHNTPNYVSNNMGKEMSQIISSVSNLNINKNGDLTHQKCKERFDSYKKDTEKRRSEFSKGFLDDFMLFLTLPDEYRQHHIMSNLLKPDSAHKLERAIELGEVAALDDDYYNDTATQARVATMRKVGGFNEYGNTQLAMVQYTLTKPGIIYTSGTYTCFSTCLMPDPVNISGTGESAEAAFNDWMINVESYISNWAPATSNKLIQQLKTLPAPPKEHPLSYIWTSDTPFEQLRSDLKSFQPSITPDHNNQRFLGGFNPYGHGQGTAKVEVYQAKVPTALDAALDYRLPTDYEIVVMPPAYLANKYTWLKSTPQSVRISNFGYAYIANRLAAIPRSMRDKFISEDNRSAFGAKALYGKYVEKERELARVNGTLEQYQYQEDLYNAEEKRKRYHAAKAITFGFTPGSYTSAQLLKHFEGVDHNGQRFQGSFNPYGNGQTLTKAQWLEANQKAFANMSKEVVNKKWENYSARQARKVVKTPVQKKTKAGGPKPNPRNMDAGGNSIKKNGSLQLSKCATIYGTALCRPFAWLDTMGKGKDKISRTSAMESPCIPMFPAIRTRKFYAFVRGNMGIQTATNHGCISFAPWRLANNNATNTCVSSPVIYSTGATAIADATFNELDTGTAWTGGAVSLNTDYTTASLVVNSSGQGVKYRVVGAGLRIKYTGAPLSRQGLVHAIEEPDHYSLSGLSVTEIGKYDNYYSEQLSNGWHTLTYTPVQQEEFEFEKDPMANVTWSTDPRAKHFIGFIITGVSPTATGDSFQYEAVVHYEAIGSLVKGKTETMIDPIGTAAVLNAVKVDNQKAVENLSLSNLLSTGANIISSGSETIKTIMPYAATAVNLLSKTGL